MCGWNPVLLSTYRRSPIKKCWWLIQMKLLSYLFLNSQKSKMRCWDIIRHSFFLMAKKLRPHCLRIIFSCGVLCQTLVLRPSSSHEHYPLTVCSSQIVCSVVWRQCQCQVSGFFFFFLNRKIHMFSLMCGNHKLGCCLHSRSVKINGSILRRLLHMAHWACRLECQH